MKYKQVKTAVIGCGMISDPYLENLKEKFSIIDLVGCADMVSEKARIQAEKYSIKQMTNEDILNDPEIELVINITYPTSHYEVSKQILSAKKHCYSEKMMCLTTEEADELGRLAKDNGVYFIIAPDTFLGASQQTARLVVDKGLIGEPLCATAHLERGYFMIKSDEDDAYRKYSVMREGGGIPYDMGGYYLHELYNIFGSVKRVCGFTGTRKQERPYLNPRHSKFNDSFFVNTENYINAVLQFECGVFCSFSISSDHAVSSTTFEISGTEGKLYLGNPNNFGDSVFIHRGNGEKLEFPICHPFATESRGVGAADLAWALRTGRKPRMTFEMGYHDLEIINAVSECTKSGQVKELTTHFERPAPISTEFYNGASEERSLFI